MKLPEHVKKNADDIATKLIAWAKQKQKHARYLYTIKPGPLDIVPAFANLVIKLDRILIAEIKEDNGEDFLDKNCAAFQEMLRSDCYSDIEKEIGQYLIVKYMERITELERKD